MACPLLVTSVYASNIDITLNMHPLCQQPTRLGRLKLFVLSTVYTAIDMSADTLHTLFLALHIISPTRPASDYMVRTCGFVIG